MLKFCFSTIKIEPEKFNINDAIKDRFCKTDSPDMLLKTDSAKLTNSNDCLY